MTKWFIQDSAVEGMAPLCDLRASFEQRTGGLTTLERLSKQMGSLPTGFLCEDASRATMIATRTGLTHVTCEIATTVDHPEITFSMGCP